MSVYNFECEMWGKDTIIYTFLGLELEFCEIDCGAHI